MAIAIRLLAILLDPVQSRTVHRGQLGGSLHLGAALITKLAGHVHANGGAHFGAGHFEVIAQLDLHHIDEHGGQGQAEHQIDHADHYVEGITGHQVAEPNCGHRDEHVVEGIQWSPAGLHH